MDKHEQRFGEYLRQLIKDAGMTQGEFYTKLGIRKPYFYDILSGHTNPPPYALQFKAMNILETNKEVREKFYDLAAKDRNELPADIVLYMKENPDIITNIRKSIKSSLHI